jgi:predicted acylesterase/phospholipase RssA
LLLDWYWISEALCTNTMQPLCAENTTILQPNKDEEVHQHTTEAKHVMACVFKGGGAKGIAYAGAIQAARQLGLITNQTKLFVGTSFGALVATMLYLDMTNEQIMQRLVEKDIMSELVADSGMWVTSPYRLMYQHGLLDSTSLENYVRRMIAEQVNNSHCIVTSHKDQTHVISLQAAKKSDGAETFAQLDAIFGASKGVGGTNGRRLVMPSVNVTRMCESILSLETTPDLSVAKAVAMSMAFPLVFTTMVYQEDEYADGGIMNNFMMPFAKNFCEKAASQRQDEAQQQDAEAGRTLGFYLLEGPMESCTNPKGIVDPTYRRALSGNLDYCERLLDLTMYSRENQNMVADPKFWDHVAGIIVPPGISTLSRNLTLAQRQELSSCGSDAMTALEKEHAHEETLFECLSSGPSVRIKRLLSHARRHSHGHHH